MDEEGARGVSAGRGRAAESGAVTIILASFCQHMCMYEVQKLQLINQLIIVETLGDDQLLS